MGLKTAEAGSRHAGAAGQAPGRLRIRFLSGSIAVAVHLMLFAILFWQPHVAPRPRVESAAIMVSLIETPRPPGSRNAMEPENIGGFSAARLTAPHLAPPVFTVAADTPDTSDLLNESQLAGAASAGEGRAGGSGCDTARLIQQALRRDRLVHTAVADANRVGKAILLWNGDWVQSGGQEGRGLSAVREAIMWEVAFAPEACRNKREHGLILLSLADGRTRFALGAADWRWSDLLGVSKSSSAR
jgi:hypothetical protein